MARTKRQRKLEERRRREIDRELARRAAVDEPTVLITRPDTKVRRALPAIAKPVDDESDYAKRLANARAILERPPGGTGAT